MSFAALIGGAAFELPVDKTAPPRDPPFERTRGPTQNTYAMILAGGRGSRLGRLTDQRAKPAVPFGGNFRIIDFTLSNCVNSGIRQIGVATQYKARVRTRSNRASRGPTRGPRAKASAEVDVAAVTVEGSPQIGPERPRAPHQAACEPPSALSSGGDEGR